MLWETNIDPTTHSSAAKSASVVQPIINAGNDLSSVQGKSMRAVVVSRKSSRLFTAASPDCSGANKKVLRRWSQTTRMHYIPFLCKCLATPIFFAFSLTHTYSLSTFFSASSTFSFCLPDLLSCQPSGLSPRDQLVQTGSVASAGFGPISAVFIVLTSEN